jgi:hypothetical protein
VEILPQQKLLVSISDGAGDNDKMVTQGYVDDAIAGGGGADNATFVDAMSMFDPADDKVFGPNGSITAIRFADAVDNVTGYFSAKMPTSASSISSINVLWYNTNPDKFVYLKFNTSVIDISNVPVATSSDTSDTLTQHPTGANTNRWTLTAVPAGAYDGITIGAGDVFGITVIRDSDDVLDTYSTNWEVGGIYVVWN